MHVAGNEFLVRVRPNASLTGDNVISSLMQDAEYVLSLRSLARKDNLLDNSLLTVGANCRGYLGRGSSHDSGNVGDHSFHLRQPINAGIFKSTPPNQVNLHLFKTDTNAVKNRLEFILPQPDVEHNMGHLAG